MSIYATTSLVQVVTGNVKNGMCLVNATDCQKPAADLMDVLVTANMGACTEIAAFTTENGTYELVSAMGFSRTHARRRSMYYQPTSAYAEHPVQGQPAQS